MSHTTRGLLFVVSSPSGAGKTTLCRRLIAEFDRLSFSVSYTTRRRRANEVDGLDYRFVDDVQFDRMLAEDRFAEWAKVHGNRYGTTRETIDAALDGGHDVVFDVDWQGARSLKGSYPHDTVMVFVLPPSMQVLRDRLRGRGTDTDDVVAKRLAGATNELSHYDEYDYLVLNDDLEAAYDEIRAAYIAAHCARQRRARFARGLLDDV